MATNKRQVDIVLYQNKNEESKAYGKWYARIMERQVLTDRALAEHIASHGSPYTVDVILGVLTELGQCSLEMMAQGMGVQLDGLGILYPTLKSAGADEDTDWNPNSHVKGVRIRFRPSSTDLDDLTSKKFRDNCKLHIWGMAVGTEPATGDTAYENIIMDPEEEEEEPEMPNP